MPESELHSRRNKKNVAVALAVCGFVALVFIITIVRIKAGLM